MRYLIASDIHGSFQDAKFIYNKFKEEEFDYLVLLGDVLYHGPRNDLPEDYNPKAVITLLNQIKDKIICIKGNCEAYVDQMVLQFKILECHFIDLGTKTYYLCHGHKLLFNKDDCQTNQIVLYGHYHIPSLKVYDDITYINVGSIALPKENNPKTYAILDENGIKIFDIKDNELFSY